MIKLSTFIPFGIENLKGTNLEAISKQPLNLFSISILASKLVLSKLQKLFECLLPLTNAKTFTAIIFEFQKAMSATQVYNFWYQLLLNNLSELF